MKKTSTQIEALQQKLAAYLLQADELFEQEKFEESLKTTTKTLQLIEQESADMPNIKISLYNLQGHIYFCKTQYKKSFTNYETALNLQLLLTQPNLAEKAKALLGLGQSGMYSEKVKDKSLAYLEESLKIALENNYTQCLSDIYNAIGNYHQLKGNWEESLHFLHKVIEVQNDLYGQVTIPVYFINIASIYSLKGAHGKSIQYAYKALQIVKQENKEGTNDAAITYSFLGREYIYQDQFEKGLSYCHKAFDIWKKLFGEKHQAIGYVLDMMASAYFYQEKFEEALPYFKKALQIYQSIFDKKSAEVALFNKRVGLCLFKMGKIEDAFPYYQQAEKILAKHPQLYQNQITSTYRYLAKYHRIKENYIEALQYFQKGIVSLLPSFNEDAIYSLPSVEEAYPNQEFFRLVNNKAATFYEKYLKEKAQNKGNLKDLKAAYQTYLYACLIIDCMRKDYSTEMSNFLLNRESTTIYGQSIEVCHAFFEQSQNALYIHKAFSLSEQEKVHLLKTAINEVEAKTKAHIPQNLLQQELQYQKEITQLKDNLLKVSNQHNSTNEDEVVSIESRLFDLNHQYEKLIHQFEKDYPKYYQLKYNSQLANIDSIQSYLRQKNQAAFAEKTNLRQILISYFVSETYIYIFKITADTYSLQKVEKPAHFHQLIIGFNKAINSVEIEDFLETAIELYDLLITPLQLEKSPKQPSNLTILRHDVLHYLPFDALFFPPANRDFEAAEIYDFHDLDYLIYHFNIAYHYSATLLLHSEKRQQHTNQQAATFLGFAPVNFVTNTTEKNELTLESYRGKSKVFRNKNWGENILGNLPNTAIEVEEVYQLFHQQKLSAKAFLYDAASKQNLFEEASKHKYVLISTHGFQYDETGNLTGIYLANGGEEIDNQTLEEASEKRGTNPSQLSKNSNTILTTSESYLLSLQADLVVLSSCSSGIGRLQKGEGMMAMHRGFLYAGASNIIFTQFDIPDEMSSLLIKKLFAAILEGNTYTAALRKAKLHILKQEGVSPQDWAAFALIGR